MKPRVSYEKKRSRSVRKGLLALGVIAAVAALQGSHQPSHEDLLWQHRNLGKAFYENPTTQKEAVAEFRKALDLDPGSVRERLNYGLALLKAEDRDHGVAQLEAVQKQDPSFLCRTHGSTSESHTKLRGIRGPRSSNSRVYCGWIRMNQSPTITSRTRMPTPRFRRPLSPCPFME